MTTTTLSNSNLASSNVLRATSRGPSLGMQIWNGLSRLGALRAASQMRQLARQYDTTRPELSRMLRAAASNGLNG